MKKIFMTLAAAFVAVSMNAQMYVGGSLGFNNTSYDGNSSTSLTIKPELGYCLDENMAVGITLGYGSDKSKTSNGTELTDDGFTIAPYFRYTFLKAGNFSVFADGEFAYTHSNNQYEETTIVSGTTIYSAADSKSNAWGISVKPGIAYQVSDKFSLVTRLGGNGLIGYKSSKPDYDGAKATNTLSLLDVNSLGLTFGLYYSF